jgi:uncharacterized protein YndB with AHSA1/START domain
MNPPLATKHLEGGRTVLRFERRLAHSPEKVWRALTDPDELSHWFPATVEMELRPGGSVSFHQDEPALDDMTGEVVEVDPPKLLSYRWDGDLLRWELIPDGDGCRLLFSHTLSGGGTWGDERFAAQHAAGWDVCLVMLTARLDGSTVDGAMDAWFPRNERYVEKYGLAEGEFVEDDGGYVLRFERVLVQTPEAAWTALTESTAPAAGCMPPAPLTTVAVPAGPIAAVGPDRALEYEWHHDGQPAGRVRWSVDGKEYACHLVLTQTVPARLADRIPAMLAAWQVHLELFVAGLHDQPRPWPTDRVETLRRMYAERLDASTSNA